ncbi:MAG: 4Fe-4S dicluster domain-containing protein [Clostridia bacterium]|nr:4Fe-4S dicluster domain-containing protein [Clostridia bacterium]
MVTNDMGFVFFRHMINVEVSKLAWEDQLNEDTKEALVHQLIPGPLARFRCCIYKEREIVRDRIRLACNQDIAGNQPGMTVQVIEPACQECPLQSYSVTDNCRLCMGKPCQSSCRFNAINIGAGRMFIDPNKCKECGQCAQNCPFGAIVHLVRPCKSACPVGAISYDDYGLCVIDENKCIECGQCIHSCSFAAIASRSSLVDIIGHIKAGHEVYAMCAPATEGQFGEGIGMPSLRKALKEVGFTDMVEVGLGGDMTAAYESAEWSEAYHDGRKMTTSCCPAFINMLKKHFPKQYQENLSSTVSPMCAVSRYLKSQHKDCITVFVGPCIAKKSEAKDRSVPDNADYAVTYGEITALLDSRNIQLAPVDDTYQESSVFGKGFASSGGVSQAVMECMKERGEDVDAIRVCKAAGGAECKKALSLLKAGRLPEDFIEGMACVGGCVGGPSKHQTESEIRRARENLLKKADSRKILENLASYPMDSFSMHRDGSPSGLPV